MVTVVNRSFEAPIIKPKGATLREINEHLYDLSVYTKSVKRITFTQQDVDEYLDAGVGNFLAGIGEDFVLEVKDAHIQARHLEARPFTTIAPYVGDLRTALGISANGIAMGYNRKSDGVWINSVSIDATTGIGTFLGGVVTGSTIDTAVTTGGYSLSTITSYAITGYNIDYALRISGTTILQGVLKPTNAGAIAVGSITWNSSTGALTGGSGIAITEAGIIGAVGGVASFTLDAATGNATFAGDILTSKRVVALGSNSYGAYTAAIIAIPPSGSTAMTGIVGSGIAFYGECTTGNVFVGIATGVGGVAVSGSSFGSTATGVNAANSGGGVALAISGKVTKAHVAGDYVDTYDSGTGAYLNTFRYGFN